MSSRELALPHHQLEYSGKVGPALHLDSTAELTLVMGNAGETAPTVREQARWPCHLSDVRCHGFGGDALHSREMVSGSLEQESYSCSSPVAVLRRADPSPLLGSTLVFALVEGAEVSCPEGEHT